MPPAARQVFGEGLEEITRYVDILTSRGIDWGLLGPREADRVWQRHIMNSTAIVELIPPGARVADIGSGAGLPGLPLAIARPDLRLTLVESLLRRTEFLTQVVAELGLHDRVQVVRSRAEQVEDHFDVVTARAVAPLEKLVGWTRKLFVPGGELLAIKGVSAADEIAGSERSLKQLRLSAELLEIVVPGADEPTYVVRVR